MSKYKTPNGAAAPIADAKPRHQRATGATTDTTDEQPKPASEASEVPPAPEPAQVVEALRVIERFAESAANGLGNDFIINADDRDRTFVAFRAVDQLRAILHHEIADQRAHFCKEIAALDSFMEQG